MIAAMAFTPRPLRKGDEVRLPETIDEETALLFDGWVDGDPTSIVDPHRHVEVGELDSAVAAARVRSTHTGTQTSDTISDLTEAVQDIVGGLLGAGSNVVVTYDDAANTLSIASTASGSSGLDVEAVRDAIGIALVGIGNIAVTVNDAADTITISTTATANSTDAALRDRSTHTGTQAASTVTGLAPVATTGVYGDLTGKPTIPSTPGQVGADPAGSSAAAQSYAVQRANHTGTQTSATISDLTEAVQDIVGAFFGAGTGAAVTYNDAANTITVSATGTSDPEVIRDTIGAALIGVGNISVVVNDVGDTITISTTATANSTDAALRDRSTHTGTETIAAMPSGTTITVLKDPATGFWPTSYGATGTPSYTGGSASAGVRPTGRSDIFVTWKGPDPSPAIVSSGTAGMLNNVDDRKVTP